MTDAALVDAALRKSGLISNGCSGLKFIHMMNKILELVVFSPGEFSI
jgi:hypothetical protein